MSAKQLMEILLSLSNAGIDLATLKVVKPGQADDFFFFEKIKSVEVDDENLILE